MADFVFPPIEQHPVEDEIIVWLRKAIVSGQFKPGAYLNETDIAKQMALSRIPIREAIKKLEQEGLVVRYPNKGVYVISFSEKDVREVFSLRSNLESMAFEWAIPRITYQDVEHLRELVKNQKDAIAAGDYSKLARLDMQFHEYICVKANHSRLLKAWYEQHAQSQILLNLRFEILSEYTPETVTGDHSDIIGAIETKDMKKAIELTLIISKRVAQECVDTIKKLESERTYKEVLKNK
jgi:DNA-binding GntR family transcriptional regulator